MRRFQSVVLLVMFSAIFTVHASASPFDLAHWGFNINGDVSMGGYDWGYDPLPDSVDDSGFDWFAGLGTVTVSLDPGVAGDYHVLSLFDHEAVAFDNVFCNEYGSAPGTPGAGQSWEIDEPGYVSGDIIDNFTAGAFDNANSVDIMFPDDVSMGMGWDFTLKAYEKAVITFLLGEEIPEGFYLAHTDPDSQETVYFSATLGISGGSPAVPEPGTVLLLSAGFAGLAGIRKKFAGRV